MVKFNQHHVTDGTIKARVFYCLDNRIDKQACVTMYAKDYGHALGRIFDGCYKNDTDTQTDYFDKGKAVLFEGHPLYLIARARVASFIAAQAVR